MIQTTECRKPLNIDLFVTCKRSRLQDLLLFHFCITFLFICWTANIYS